MSAIRSLWLSLFCVSASWLYILPAYEEPWAMGWALLLLAAVALAVHAVRETEFAGPTTVTALLAVPAALSAALISFPYNTGPTLLLVGCLLVLAGARAAQSTEGTVTRIHSGGVARLGAGIALAGAVASVQALVLAPYFALASRYHETAALGHLAVLVLRATGADVALTLDGLLLHTGWHTIVHSLTWEKFGALMLLLFVAGAIPLLAVAPGRRYASLMLLALAYVYAELRFALLVLMMATSARLDVFWSRPASLLTFLPLAVVAPTLLSTRVRGRIVWPSIPVRERRFHVAVALATLGVLALVGAWGFESPGSLKQGRVIMEEGHSDWAWTGDAYDTEWYGERSGYNYYSLYQYLGHYYEIEVNTSPISDAVLSECDVFIVKMPTTAFTAEEVESIVTFVRDGGGLFLIGDHTNVFGTSTNMNPLAERFGLSFNHDATYELTAGALSEYRRPDMLPHPIVQHLPERFLFGTSSSMHLSPRATSVIVDHGLKALDADYSQESFFSEVSISPEMRFGSFVQGGAARYGRGRVAAFADSTVFSNFWVFMSGKSELALSYVDWLNRDDTVPHARLLLLGGGILTLAAAVATGHGAGRQVLVLAVAAGVLLGVPAGVRGWAVLNSWAYPSPEPRTDYVRVCFDREHSEFTLPDTLEGFTSDWQHSLYTFYVWTQRLGYVPSAHESLMDAIAYGDVVVVTNPVEAPSDRQIEALTRYVEEGGSLLLMDELRNTGSTAGAFLEPFGLSFDRTPLDRGASYEAAGPDGLVPLSEGAMRVEGGTPLVMSNRGDVIGAYASRAGGSVVAFGDSSLFYTVSLGDVSRVPDARQREIGELEFGLMRLLAEGDEFDW